MQPNVRTDCPKCGRPLKDFNGRIGFCSQHNWVSPNGLGFDAEAAERNQQEAALKERHRLDAEQKKAAEEAQRRREQHQSAVRKAIFVVIALCAIAAVITIFIIRPSMNYNRATSQFTAGEYEAARDEYIELGDYKDSQARVLLCDAMIDLREGRTEDATDKLVQLTNAGQSDAAKQLADALLPIVTDWKAKGLTPQMLLLLLSKADVIDPNGTLDVQALSVEGHTALLEGTPLSVYADDINGDGETELIALNRDYSVTAYRMALDSNVRLELDNASASACATTFGKSVIDADISSAVACFQEAYRLLPNEETHSNLAENLCTAISEWKSRDVAASSVPAMIYMADAQGVELSEIDREAIYEDAALISAGNIVQSDFVDWNGDGYKELLALNDDGILSLYGVGETWGVVSAVDTRLPGCSYVIADEVSPLILVLAPDKDEFLAVSGTSDKLSVLFRESGINRFIMNGTAISYSRELEGSIVRNSDYSYEASGTDNRPTRIGIDWQQNDYPQPESAQAAIRRYFEARAYEISDEVALLTGTAINAGSFSLDILADLAVPDIPGRVEAAAYETEDSKVLFEVLYPAGAQNVRTWVMAEYIDGWKVVGAADTYGIGLDPSVVDYSLPLLSLNAETVNTLSAKGERNTYRVLVPSAGRLGLLWQSGSKATSRTSHTVTMVRGTLTGDTVFTYELQPSPNKQQSKDMFVPAGVYYVTVEAKIADAEEYHLTITFGEETNVELENNDTSANATPIVLNTPYSATLSNAKDVDYFTFSLEETNAVNVTLGSSGAGSRSTTYAYAIYRDADGSRLASVEVPGNAQLSETGNLYLSPGIYFVQVAKGSSFTNDKYILTVNASQNGIMEAEPNNTQETANIVSVNEDIHGSFAQEGDVDFYSFTLENDAVIQSRFTFTPTDSSSKTYVLTVMDSNRRELLKVNIGGKESTKVIAPLALTAGSYTVKIENPRFVRQDYTLCLVSMAVDFAEREPNDSAGLATALAAGQSRTGVLSSEADVDYYNLSFAEETTVTFRFSFAQSTITNTAFVLSIEQNGKTQWTANVKGDSGGTEQMLQFPAGEYYLKVKPSTWISAVYTIEIK